jgi:hypothetical protein
MMRSVSRPAGTPRFSHHLAMHDAACIMIACLTYMISVLQLLAILYWSLSEPRSTLNPTIGLSAIALCVEPAACLVVTSAAGLVCTDVLDGRC